MRESGGWSVQPVQLQFHPFTGEVLRRTSFASQVAEVGWRRALRGLNRTVHTGEAGGWFGQTLAFLACVGGMVLVYTGFALSWRRFFKRRPVESASARTAMAVEEVEAVPAAVEAVVPMASPRTLE